MRSAILGSKGLVGDAFSRNCSHAVLFLSRQDVDLLDTAALSDLLIANRIDTVVNCAAKVGGIELNRSEPYNMFTYNISISLSVLQASISAGASNLVQFCSNCAYPVSAHQPYKESTLLDGPPYHLNKGYAAAKLSALKAGQCAEDQGLIRVFHPIPCSLFGLRDNYSLNNSHFIAAVIRKVYSAVSLDDKKIEFWGTGNPYREFMFADHLVSAIDHLLEKQLSYDPVNIGTGVDTPIKDIIEHICTYSGYRGSIYWDHSKPDGALHKLLDSSILYSHGWEPPLDLLSRLSETFDYFVSNQDTLRL
jgi:GDP-L-fucose synthase